MAQISEFSLMLGALGNNLGHISRDVLGLMSGHAVVYGDAEDPELASTLPLSHARWVVSSMAQLTVNLALLQALSHHGFSGRIAATAHNDGDAARLRDAGSDLVLLPFLDAAREAVDELCGAMARPLFSLGQLHNRCVE